MEQREEDAGSGTPRDEEAARLSGVADDLARTASALRRAVEERAAPDGTMALVARIEDVVARMRRQAEGAASNCEGDDGEGE
jgi:hypothetical protein